MLFYDCTKLHGEFSNFYALKPPLRYMGRDYATSEHLYQSLKFLYVGASSASIAYADQIRRASTPNKAKILARQRLGGQPYAWRQTLNATIRRGLADGAAQRSDWAQVRESRTKFTLMLKFTQNLHCRAKLEATLVGTPLVENTVRDTFWANGGVGGAGLNRLGALLGEVRDNLCTRTLKTTLIGVARQPVDLGDQEAHATVCCETRKRKRNPGEGELSSVN